MPDTLINAMIGGVQGSLYPSKEQLQIGCDYQMSYLSDIPVESALQKTTVYFDGSCYLCRAEISYYQRKDHDRSLCFVNIAETSVTTPEGISQESAMKRFHVRTREGAILSGAAAFIEVWARLPGWRWVARAASLPGATKLLECGYRLFLPVRPFISKFLGTILRFHALIIGPKRL